MGGFTFDLTVTLSFALSVAVLIYTWWRTRDQNTDARFKAGSERMDRHEVRLNSMEQTVRGLPDQTGFNDLKVSMERLQGDLKTTVAVMEANKSSTVLLQAGVARIESYLLERKP